MNRYVIEGVRADALAGKRVLVVPDSLRDAEQLFAACAEHDLVDRVTRTNGRQSVEYKTGGAVVVRRSDGVRGMSADVIVLGPALGLIPEVVTDAIRATTAGSGEVVRL